ncbi:hypothetical protein [Klebsiella aerogenes]|uniref:hypothetical protein n=1 Tax=Klebsiella aerogenes TaxID=548 RepID=UPI00140FFB2B|nr:hypothetical protein [Klebsiella aerogenes]QIP24285.1 hypothetical protein HA513_07915 [Klebsiella aerogenes]
MISLLHWSVFLLLFIPKINLISVGGFNAGLRLDDLIIAFWAVIFVSSFFMSRNYSLSKIEVQYYIFILIISLCTLFTSAVYAQGTILFPLRFLEYFTFFIMGLKLGQKDDYISGIMKVIFFANIAVSFLQFVGIIGGFTTTGYRDSVSARVIGLCSGPWELGVILNFLTCYFLSIKVKETFKYLVFFTALSVIFLSGSRMSFVAQMILMVIYVYQSSSFVGILKRVLILAPFVAIALVFVADSTVASRSENLFNMDNIVSIPETYRTTQLVHGNPDWSLFGVLSGDDVDASWAIRSLKWVYAVKLFVSEWIFSFTGVGAGTFGNALDGGWLRLFTECGVLGFVAFIMFMKQNSSVSNMNKLMFISFSINMIMIDIYMSYKVMSFMLFIFGYMYSKSKTDEPLPRNRTIKFISS